MRSVVRQAGAGLAVLALMVGTAGSASAHRSATDAGGAGVVDDPVVYSADDARLNLTPTAVYQTGIFDESAQEIVAYHARTNRLFTVNAELGLVEVVDAATMTKVGEVTSAGTAAADGSTIPDGAVANSIAVRRDGLGVVAIESDVKTDQGWLLMFDASSMSVLGAVRVGALPDMVALSEQGFVAVVANEGEPNDDYTVDPEGSISVVRLPWTMRHTHLRQSMVRTADFHSFEDALPEGVRVFGPEVNTEYPVSANLEPEYATVSGGKAYVTLQENNAIAVVDLWRAEVTEILPLGYKDWGTTALDPSDKDDAIDLRTFDGLRGLYLPDAIASYSVRGATYLVTANEGDAREWGDYEEGSRIKDLADQVCADSPLAAYDLTDNDELGRLDVTTASGLTEDGCYQNLYTFGARSFSIWTTDGELVYDSGSEFEEVTAAAVPEHFNSDHSETNLEGRSDNKGPEPEGVTIGKVGGRTYAFVGFERIGGVIVYDVTRPSSAEFVTYVNNRDFAVSVDDGGPLAEAGDLGPEGLTFLPAGASPTRQPMLAVANEVSGTTTLFSVTSSR